MVSEKLFKRMVKYAKKLQQKGRSPQQAMIETANKFNVFLLNETGRPINTPR